MTLASLCAEVYTAPESAWDHYWQKDDVVVAHRRSEGLDVLAFRGTMNCADLFRDFDTMAKRHPLLGWVHRGFLAGMDDVCAEALPVLGSRIALVGHSLGAARALIMLGLLAAQRVAVESCLVLGSPRPGCGDLAKLVRYSGAKVVSYKNRHDPVTDVPPAPLYEHPVESVALDVAPPESDVTLWRDHHVELYVRGVEAL